MYAMLAACLPLHERALCCTYPAFAHHVSGTIARARCDPASVTYAAYVHDLAAVCHPIASLAGRVVPSAHAARICHISCAVALAREDARSTAHLLVVERMENMVTNGLIKSFKDNNGRSTPFQTTIKLASRQLQTFPA